MNLNRKDVLSWIAHSAELLAFMLIIGYFAGYYVVWYVVGSVFFFMREAKQNKWNFKFWTWKFDSIMDFVAPMVAGGAALGVVL